MTDQQREYIHGVEQSKNMHEPNRTERRERAEILHCCRCEGHDDRHHLCRRRQAETAGDSNARRCDEGSDSCITCEINRAATATAAATAAAAWNRAEPSTPLSAINLHGAAVMVSTFFTHSPALVVFFCLTTAVLLLLFVTYLWIGVHLIGHQHADDQSGLSNAIPLAPTRDGTPHPTPNNHPRGFTTRASIIPGEGALDWERDRVTLSPTISAYSTQTVRGLHTLSTMTALLSVGLMLLNVLDLDGNGGESVQPLAATITNGICYFALMLVGIFPTKHPHPEDSISRPSTPLGVFNVPAGLGALIHGLAALCYLLGPTIVGLWWNWPGLHGNAQNSSIFFPLCVIAIIMALIFMILAGLDGSVVGSVAILPRKYFPAVFIYELVVFSALSALYLAQEVANYYETPS